MNLKIFYHYEEGNKVEIIQIDSLSIFTQSRTKQRGFHAIARKKRPPAITQFLFRFHAITQQKMAIHAITHTYEGSGASSKTNFQFFFKHGEGKKTK